MPALTENDIHAMILLLDDDDEYIVDSVRKRLLVAVADEPAIPIVSRLRTALVTAPPRSREHIETILEEIQWVELEQRFRTLVRTHHDDIPLEKGVFLLASFAYGFRDEYLATVTNRSILFRMIHNLIMIYSRTDDTRKAEQLVRYAEILQ